MYSCIIFWSRETECFDVTKALQARVENHRLYVHDATEYVRIQYLLFIYFIIIFLCTVVHVAKTITDWSKIVVMLYCGKI